MNTKIIAGIILLAGLILGGWLVFGQNKSQVPETFQYAEGVPCHSMGGFYMGECDFDKDGNPTNL